jgi:hypothetical protein
VPYYIGRAEAIDLYAPDDPDVDEAHVFQGDVFAPSLQLMAPRPGGAADWVLTAAIVVSHDCEFTKAKRRPEHPILVAPLHELGSFPADQQRLIRENRYRYLLHLPEEDPLDREFAVDLRLMQPVAGADVRDALYLATLNSSLRQALRAKVVVRDAGADTGVKLDFFLIADAAQSSERSKLAILGAGISRIEPPMIPFVLPRIAVVARLLVEEGDTNEHEITLRWLRPTGEPAAPSIVTSFSAPKPERELMPAEEHAINIVAETQLALAEEGPYTVELDLDGQPAARKVIPVGVAG